MKKTIAAIALALSLALSACGATVTEGTITDKNYTEAHVEQEEIMEQDCDTKTTTVNGKKKKTKHCEMEGTGEFEDVEYPDEWSFDLENKDGDTGTVEVDEDTYNEYEVGDFYKDE